MKIDSLLITPKDVTLIIPNREIEEKMKDEVQSANIGFSFINIPVAERQDWHFIVLEDLGYNFNL